MDTIFAPATARGRAGVAVIRISGPDAHAAAAALCGALPPPRQAGLRRLRHRGEVLDEALVLVFEAGRSFTGEPVVELQTHGSPAVLSAVLQALGTRLGLRLAEPGEFTRRALINGRMDLAQVEGLSDLLAAETAAQRRQAQRLLSGALGQKAEAWRQQLIRALALLEASIDFSDEELPEDLTAEVADGAERLLAALRVETAGAGAAERVRDGFEVALLGPPNIGKSTLINALAGRDAAITSAEAGTTRDIIEVRMDLGGLAVTVLDTAGLRAAEGEVERIGIARTRERAAAADLRVFLLPAGAEPDPELRQPDDIVLLGKADLHDTTEPSVSGLTGAGVDALLSEVTRLLSDRAASAGSVVRERHRLAVTRAVASLEGALATLTAAGPVELAAEELRDAMRALDSLVGRVDVEHILDEVFSSFCIGK